MGANPGGVEAPPSAISLAPYGFPPTRSGQEMRGPHTTLPQEETMTDQVPESTEATKPDFTPILVLIHRVVHHRRLR